MEFGHIEDIEAIDFTLPPETAFTQRTLAEADPNVMFKVYVGASKWNEKTWKGKIYPTTAPDNELLPHYAQNFNTVEFGTSFYNIYTADQISRWTQQITENPEFLFCPKFPQAITHVSRLVNAEEKTANFYQSLAGFGRHLGPLLLQLPDSFTPKSLPQLKTYLQTLPQTIKVHVELRNQKWFADKTTLEELLTMIQQLKIGTIISDTAGRRDAVHMELTTSDVIIRFVGNNLAESDYSRMDAWVERISAWKGTGLKTLWFFMHQNNESFVPEACDYLIKKLNERLGTAISRPKFLNSGNSNAQHDLFSF